VFCTDRRGHAIAHPSNTPVKKVDKPTSSVNTPDMCMTVKFSTAVVSAIRDVCVTKNSDKFSAYDITQHLREQCNQGELAFSDRISEDVRGDGTVSYRIEHPEVKEIIEDLYNARLLTRSYNARGYWDYSSGFQANSTVQLATASQPVTAPKPSTTKSHVIAATSDPLAQKIQDYIQGRGNGAIITLKQIQSRFKGLPLTCASIAMRLETIGYNVNKVGNYTSKWTVDA